MFEFLTFGLNFSLFLRGRANFSLLVWISHFVAAHAPISHFSSEILTYPAGPTPTPAGPFRVAGRPSTTPALPMTSPAGPLPRRPSQWHSYYHVIDGLARAGRSPLDIQKVRKVRNSGWKVRNWSVCGDKVRNSNQKWEFCASALEKWEIQTKSENWNIFICVLVRNSRVKWNLG